MSGASAYPIYQPRLNAMTKRESRVMRTWKISRPAVPRHPVGVVRRGTLRAAIIIIFTNPRVIKAARYTCSVRGRPLLTARTTPLDGSVGVATARSRGGHSQEGAKRRNGEGNELESASGVFVDGEERRSTWNRDGIYSGRMRRVGGKGG